VSVLTTRFLIQAFLLRLVNTRALIYARHLTLILPLVEEFLTPLDLYVQILEFEPWWTSCWSESLF